MSEFKLKENTGFIFKNEHKKADNHPDYKGNINVDGKEKEIALWVKEKNGKKYFSASISNPYIKEHTKEPENLNKDDSDLPF